MTTAIKPKPTAKTKPAPTLCRLFEIAHSSSEANVDEESGVIRNVKVVGLESENTGRAIGLSEGSFGAAVDRPYAYTLDALRKAIPLYEGIGVYVDHPEFTQGSRGQRVLAKQDRKVAARFGRLVNVRVTESGMYATLEYLKSHELAPRVVEAARRMPEQFALSHNAGGRPVLRNGRILIEEISDVKSVDLIGERPGTTHGLFESEPNMEPMLDPMAGAAASEAEEPKPADVLSDAMIETVVAALKKADADKFRAVLEVLELSDSVSELATGSKPAGGDAKPEGDKPVPESKKKPASTDPTVVTLQEENRLLKAENESRQLLESAGVSAEPAKLKALIALESAEDRKALVETWPKASASPAAPAANRPRSSLLESRADRNEPIVPKDPKAFAALVR